MTVSTLSFDVQKFFPKGEYQNRCREDKKLATLYQIANNGKQATIFQLLERFGCDYQEPRWGLTSVHVAVMMRSYVVLEHLIEKQASLKVVDHQGFSPMLYACALHDVKSMRLLQEAQKVEVVLEVYHHFPEWKAILEPEYPSPDEVVCETTENEPITARRFQELTGAAYHPRCVATEERWIEHVTDRLEHGVPVHKRARINSLLQEELERNPPFPKLHLGPQGGAGMGVFAGEKISRGCIITLYGGEYGESKSNYIFAGIDGKKVRNLGPQINDGFPNASLYAVRYPDGRTVGLVLAHGEIQEGEPILLDYRSHQAKVMAHEEIALEELERFFHEHRFREVYALRDRMDSIQAHCEVGFKKHRALYLCHTPTALLILYLKKVVTEAELKVILALPETEEVRPQLSRMLVLLKSLSLSDVEEKMITWLQRYALQSIILVMDTPWFRRQLEQGELEPIERAFSAFSESFMKFSTISDVISDLGRLGRSLPSDLGEMYASILKMQFEMALTDSFE